MLLLQWTWHIQTFMTHEGCLHFVFSTLWIVSVAHRNKSFNKSESARESVIRSTVYSMIGCSAMETRHMGNQKASLRSHAHFSVIIQNTDWLLGSARRSPAACRRCAGASTRRQRSPVAACRNKPPGLGSTKTHRRSQQRRKAAQQCRRIGTEVREFLELCRLDLDRVRSLATGPRCRDSEVPQEAERCHCGICTQFPEASMFR